MQKLNTEYYTRMAYEMWKVNPEDPHIKPLVDIVVGALIIEAIEEAGIVPVMTK